MNDATSRRQKRIQTRKQQIMLAAAKLIAQKGFANTTTKEIAEAAEVAEGTIYNYFKSKDDILLELVNTLANLENREAEISETFHAADYRQALVENIRNRIEFIREVYPFYLAILPEILSTPHLREQYYTQFIAPANQMIHHFIQAGVGEGILNTSDPLATARIISAIFMGFQTLHILGDQEFITLWEDSQRLAEAVTNLFYDGLQPLKKP